MGEMRRYILKQMFVFEILYVYTGSELFIVCM